ncbi:MAG: hypothetical protein SA339_03885 [Methanomassiliicoccus sp.]|nr:hypothetical protein [Methanomassiliicoccus sp.]
MSEHVWTESGLICTRCERRVTRRTWPNGILMMKCDCIKKVGHGDILPARSWIDKECRDDVRVRNGALVSSYAAAYFD